MVFMVFRGFSGGDTEKYINAKLLMAKLDRIYGKPMRALRSDYGSTNSKRVRDHAVMFGKP